MLVKPNIQFNHMKQNKPPSAITGCIKMHMQSFGSGMDTSALYITWVWFQFACYAKDVSKAGTLRSALTKPKLKSETYALRHDPG